MNFKQLCIALLFISGTAPVQAISFVEYSPDKAMTMGVFALFMGMCMKLAKDKYDQAHRDHAQNQSLENTQDDQAQNPEETEQFLEPQPLWPDTVEIPSELLFPADSDFLVDQNEPENDTLYQYLTSTC